MNHTKTSNNNLLIFGIPILLIASVFVLTYSTIFKLNVSQLSIAATLDLVFTIPIVYFFLIRKTTIDKKTVVPFFILGIVIASFIIPKENQGLLDTIKTWIVPIIEITVFILIVLNIRKAIKIYKEKKEQSFDLATIIRETCASIFPKKAAGFLSVEILSFYYGFIHWRKVKLKENEFTYHKNTGTQVLLIAVIFLIGIETVAFHALLIKYNTIAAWILTGISIYSGFQIFGFLRSLNKRPIIIEHDILKLRYGIMRETDIEIHNISSIQLTNKSLEPNEEIKYLSFLGSSESHNVIIHLKKENILTGLYGTSKKFRSIVLFVDEKEKFKSTLENKL